VVVDPDDTGPWTRPDVGKTTDEVLSAGDETGPTLPLGSSRMLHLPERDSTATLPPTVLVRPRRRADLASLRRRLQGFLVPLGLGFVLLLLRNLAFRDADPIGSSLHLIVLGLLGVGLGLVVSGRPLEARTLRSIELAAVTALTFYFAVAQGRILVGAARDGDTAAVADALRAGAIDVVFLIVLYGLLIPNTVRRAAAVVLPVALVPTVTSLLVIAALPDLHGKADHFALLGRVADNAVVLLLGAVTALYGTATAQNLRAQVREARRLGPYALGERLGSGGMGEVFLAEHDLLKRPAAIKRIRPEMAGNPQALARFELEVRATARLSHPNTIEIYDFGHADDGTFYYVMEYLPGLTLAALGAHHGPLPPGRVVYLLRQVCGALAEAHGLGLVHRDLKPANIFASRRGGLCDVAKVLDFGLVKPLHDPSLALEFSRAGSVRGTPHYMAPEQATGQPLDPRSDLYALGAVAYFLLTGRPPFEAGSDVAVLVAQARSRVVPPSSLRPEIPPDLEAVVLACLAKSQDDRPPDAHALRRALGACACAADWDDEAAVRWWAAHGL
jgi:serine/threonine-protein kinase